MSSIIIGIHGLGNKPPKDLLEKWWKKSIAEGLKTNGYPTKMLRFEMVYWADLLYDQPLNINEKDPNSAYFVDEPYREAPENYVYESHETRKKLVDYLSKQMNSILLNEDFSLNYKKISDSIIHKYFRDLESYYSNEAIEVDGKTQNVKTAICERLISVLQKHAGKDILLIAHSMGSIIAYDVLRFIAPHIPVHTFATIGSPLGIAIVKSKIVAEQVELSDETVEIKTPDSIVKNWCNFSDITDKVAFDYKLSDDFGPNSLGVKPADFLVDNNYTIQGRKNPHKSYGYLRTSAFSKVLYEFMTAEKLTFKEKISRKLQQFTGYLKNRFQKAQRRGY